MQPSTSALSGWLGIDELKRLTQSLAMLDAILCPEWDSRYYSYNCKWSQGEEMASMRDGSGDDWFLLFNSAGAALKGFAHEAPFAQDPNFAHRILEQVPSDFSSFLNEAAFSMSQATFCLWRRSSDASWTIVSRANIREYAEDGSGDLLHLLDGNPASYQAWAESYYEIDVDIEAVKAIYTHSPLTSELIGILNPALDSNDLIKDLAEIGYPCST